jgi:uncharacterized lipoprotein YmbA
MKKNVSLLLLVFVISCGHVPQTHYYLIDVAGPTPTGIKKNSLLWLKTVSTDALHSQDRLMYRTSAYEIQFDPYRRWALAPAEMIKQKTMDYLRQSGLFVQVTDELPKLERSFWSLTMTINQFEEFVSSDKRFGRMLVHVQVGEGPAEKLLWEGDVQAEALIQGSDVSSIIQAMSAATEKVLQQVTEQLLQL